jgi:hypothetical protein
VLRLARFALVHGPQSLLGEIALAALDLELPEVARAKILCALATVAVRAMRTDQAMDYATRAIAHADRAGDPVAKSLAAIRQAEVCQVLGQERACRALLREAVVASEQSGDRSLQVRARVAIPGSRGIVHEP